METWRTEVLLHLDLQHRNHGDRLPLPLSKGPNSSIKFISIPLVQKDPLERTPDLNYFYTSEHWV